MAPSIKSAKAIFMIRKKLFFWRALLTAKRTRVSKFPVIIKTDDNAKALHNAMPSAIEGILLANSDAFFTLSFTGDVSIIINVQLSD